MIRYATYDPVTGSILRTGLCAEDDLALQGTCIASETADGARHYIVDGELRELPERPSRWHTWAGESVGWADLREVGLQKETKGQEINAWRLEANRSYFTFGGKQIACDGLSRSDIDGVTSSVALTSSLPPGFPGAWKAMDNSYVPIPDVATWAALVSAMVSQGTLNFMRAQGLKALLASCTTVEQIDAITWETPLGQ